METDYLIKIFEKYASLYAEKVIAWSMNNGIKVLFIAIGAYFIHKILVRFIAKAVRIAVRPEKHQTKEAEEKRENTLIQIFTTTSKIAIITISSLMILSEFGIEIAPIIAAAGIVGLAFGFGGQYLIRDVISGLFIILENQYRIGDVVKFDVLGGAVEQISLRKTTLRDIDGTVHHIPHGEIKSVSNLSKDYARVNLDMGVGYATDLEHLITVINQVGNSIAEDPEWKDFIIKAPQFLRVNDFADSAIMVKILGETIAHRQFDVTGELRKRLKIAFDKEGIEIPFPQVVVHQAENNQKQDLKN
ncbi:mechanosensitive ion channel family protein [Flavobacterium sp. UMI-01]|uniref:mechanosensitive ion channel family protein n=1 Tax=Flavobacterium sp. UMI-01 TaxID=1441053 RepID=UPI001C7E1004|nr:mechanosensitive ion channel domain-containing protein [Flavobacterium sp. UMI-01]GIZ08130.1 mechanosensitive ion channel protein MscS [Flavobacterium sp. UMI-01]